MERTITELQEMTQVVKEVMKGKPLPVGTQRKRKDGIYEKVVDGWVKVAEPEESKPEEKSKEKELAELDEKIKSVEDKMEYERDPEKYDKLETQLIGLENKRDRLKQELKEQPKTESKPEKIEPKKTSDNPNDYDEALTPSGMEMDENEDYDQFLKDNYPGLKDLSVDSSSAIEEYRTSRYNNINGLLRTGDISALEDLDEVMEIVETLEDYIKKESSPLSKSVKFSRGDSMTEDRLDEYKVGKFHVDQGFYSVTSDGGVANNFSKRNGEKLAQQGYLDEEIKNVTFTILAPKGSRVAPTYNTNEREFILSPGQAKKVLSKKYNKAKNTWEITMKLEDMA